MKFSGNVGHGTKRKWLDFEGDVKTWIQKFPIIFVSIVRQFSFSCFH